MPMLRRVKNQWRIDRCVKNPWLIYLWIVASAFAVLAILVVREFLNGDRSGVDTSLMSALIALASLTISMGVTKEAWETGKRESKALETSLRAELRHIRDSLQTLVPPSLSEIQTQKHLSAEVRSKVERVVRDFDETRLRKIDPEKFDKVLEVTTALRTFSNKYGSDARILTDELVGVLRRVNNAIDVLPSPPRADPRAATERQAVDPL